MLPMGWRCAVDGMMKPLPTGRWHHSCCQEVSETGFLSPLEGLWLLGWQERYDVSENAIPLLERLRTRDVSARPQLVQMMQALSYWVRRDIPLAERTAATRIVEWADVHGMGRWQVLLSCVN